MKTETESKQIANEIVELSSFILMYANQLVELSDKNIDMDTYIKSQATP